MRSILTLLCLVIAARRLDAQAGDLLSRRVRLTVEWKATPEEQQSVESAFVSAGWPLVTGRGPEDRATLALFLNRRQTTADTSVHNTAWTARVIDMESGKFLRSLSCISRGSVELPSGLAVRLRRELADSSVIPQTQARNVSCSD